MVKKLYVGGIAWATTDESLRAAFAQAGNVVKAEIVKDRETGRSRGFGFVEMASEEEASAAIAMWNEKALDGRTLRVNEAMGRPEGGAPRGNGGGYGNRGGSYGGNGGGRSF